MFRLSTIILVLVLLSGFGCKSAKSDKEPLPEGQKESTGNLQGDFSIGGAYALYPLISSLAADFMKIHPGVKIEITRAATGEGISGLLSKKYNLAMISRPLTDEEVNSGIWDIAVAKDGVAPIINMNNPYYGQIIDQGLTPEEFLKIFTSGKQITWGEILKSDSKDVIDVYTRGDQAGSADVWASFIYRNSEDLKGTKVTGDDAMIKSIQDNPLAIGYCNFSYAFNNLTGERVRDIQIVPVDLDFDNKIDKKETPFINREEAHRSLWLGFYPDVLCRELTVGSVGKPTDQVILEFLYFVLTEGQKNVKEVGFCELNSVYIRNALDKLE